MKTVKNCRYPVRRLAVEHKPLWRNRAAEGKDVVV